MHRMLSLLLMAALLPAAPPVLRVSFRCLWWSPEQMVGLNPDKPPPKNTEVTIRQWAYTDPVSVPHPDTADIVIETDDVFPKGARARLRVRWKEGPIDREPLARWTPFVALATRPMAASIRVPLEIARRQAALEPRRRWPFAAEIEIAVRDAAGKLLASRTAVLPIKPGD